MRFILASVFILSLIACQTTSTSDLAQTAPDRPSVPAREPAQDARLTRILFGSCLKQEDDMPILSTMIDREPDLTVLLGDNVYGDVEDKTNPEAPELVDAYRTLAGRTEFQALVAASPILATWDDHDFGLNDHGGDFPIKEQTERLFEDFWNLDADDERRSRAGIHTAKTYGPKGERVQIILLDTRFFRSQLTTKPKGDPAPGRYVPSRDPDQTILGLDQEMWLMDVLREPADLRILVSSIQVIAEGHGWEAWRTMPMARARLFKTIEKSGVQNLVLVSGDRHLGGLYRDDEAVSYPLFELTTSSLNAPQSTRREARGDTSVEPGPKRLGDPVYEENFGEIAINWQTRALNMSVLNMNGDEVRSIILPMEPTQDRFQQPYSGAGR